MTTTNIKPIRPGLPGRARQLEGIAQWLAWKGRPTAVLYRENALRVANAKGETCMIRNPTFRTAQILAGGAWW